ncbi:MAG TPA: Na-translocating system protein MpsC family protein [Solirubrobacteraceae bacterium]|nr:Na-translocating system protein MpsC family protein [Solirubrobacteraceae bacterium]
MGATASESTHSRLLTDVANAVVRVHKRYYGKGPERARAHLSRNLLTVILEGGLTRGEQTLQDHGHVAEVVRARLAMQDAMESDFRAEIETLLYRSVRSFMSANDPRHDVQAEIFVLEPEEPGETDQGERSAETLRESAVQGGVSLERSQA